MRIREKENYKMVVFRVPEMVKKEIVMQAKKRGIKIDVYILQALLARMVKESYNE